MLLRRIGVLVAVIVPPEPDGLMADIDAALG
jgi:hypothetical protein